MSGSRVKDQRRHLRNALLGANALNQTLACEVMQSAVIALQRSGEITPIEAAAALRFDMPTYWIVATNLDKRARELIARAKQEQEEKERYRAEGIHVFPTPEGA